MQVSFVSTNIAFQGNSPISLEQLSPFTFPNKISELEEKLRTDGPFIAFIKNGDQGNKQPILIFNLDERDVKYKILSRKSSNIFTTNENSSSSPFFEIQKKISEIYQCRIAPSEDETHEREISPNSPVSPRIATINPAQEYPALYSALPEEYQRQMSAFYANPTLYFRN